MTSSEQKVLNNYPLALGKDGVNFLGYIWRGPYHYLQNFASFKALKIDFVQLINACFASFKDL